MLKILDKTILQHFSLNTFFFLQYIYILLKIFTSLLIVVISSLILLNSLSENDTADKIYDLNRFSWVNIRFSHIRFYWAYLTMTLMKIIFICCFIYVKLIFYMHIYKLFLWSSDHCLLESVNTILITDIIKKDLLILENLYSIFLDRVYFIWIN